MNLTHLFLLCLSLNLLAANFSLAGPVRTPKEEAAAEWLLANGVQDVDKLEAALPGILSASVELVIDKKFRFFKDAGFTDPARLIEKRPELLRASLESVLRPNYHALKHFGVSNEKIEENLDLLLSAPKTPEPAALPKHEAKPKQKPLPKPPQPLKAQPAPRVTRAPQMSYEVEKKFRDLFSSYNVYKYQKFLTPSLTVENAEQILLLLRERGFTKIQLVLTAKPILLQMNYEALVHYLNTLFYVSGLTSKQVEEFKTTFKATEGEILELERELKLVDVKLSALPLKARVSLLDGSLRIKSILNHFASRGAISATANKISMLGEVDRKNITTLIRVGGFPTNILSCKSVIDGEL